MLSDAIKGDFVKDYINYLMLYNEKEISNMNYSEFFGLKNNTDKINDVKFNSKSKFEYNNASKTIVAHLYDNGFEYKRAYFSDIKEIKKHESEDGAAIVVKFTDGTVVSAVVRGSDEYSFETGLAICMAKKLICDKVGFADGEKYATNLYNKLIEHAIKFYNKQEKDKLIEDKKKKEHNEFLIRLAEKKRKKKEKRREEEIEIQKEAYIRALKEVNAN